MPLRTETWEMLKNGFQNIRQSLLTFSTGRFTKLLNPLTDYDGYSISNSTLYGYDEYRGTIFNGPPYRLTECQPAIFYSFIC